MEKYKAANLLTPKSIDPDEMENIKVKNSNKKFADKMKEMKQIECVSSTTEHSNWE